jgi:uncharacterized protein YfaS (alpha-2-macroglobulin family)
VAALTALAVEAGQGDIARQLQGRLENVVKDPDALNTQEQAAVLHAAYALLKAAGPISIDAQGATALPPAGGAPRWAVGKLADARFTNTGKGALWRTVSVRGTPVPRRGPRPTACRCQQASAVDERRRDRSGEIHQGDRVIVLVSGRSMQARSTALVVDDALPAGFEIETTLGADDAQNGPFKFLGELTNPMSRKAATTASSPRWTWPATSRSPWPMWRGP